MWFNKKNPLAVFIDNREHEEKLTNRQILKVSPDYVMDNRQMKFRSKRFNLVIFDPPHISSLNQNSWMAKKYGILSEETWKADIKRGFEKCLRVLKDHGILIFKWSESDSHKSLSKTVKEVIKILGREPLFGHPTGSKGKTFWMCFVKLPKCES